MKPYLFSGASRGNRTLVLNKIQIHDNEKIKSQIDMLFSDPEKYFERGNAGNNIVIGRNDHGPRYDSQGNLIPHSVVGGYLKPPVGLRKYEFKKSISSGVTAMNRSINQASMISTKKEKNLDIISDAQLNELFENCKTRKTQNLTHTNDFLEVMNPQIKRILLFQEKALENREALGHHFNKMKKRIAQKAKKNEEALLMNHTDGFRLKKEAKEIIDNKIGIETRYGVNNWVMALRRPSNFHGIRCGYVNAGNERDPTWLLVKEHVPIVTETIRNPESSCDNEMKTLTSNEYFKKTLNNFGAYMNNIPQYDGLKVEKRRYNKHK